MAEAHVLLRTDHRRRGLYLGDLSAEEIRGPLTRIASRRKASRWLKTKIYTLAKRRSIPWLTLAQCRHQEEEEEARQQQEEALPALWPGARLQSKKTPVRPRREQCFLKHGFRARYFHICVRPCTLSYLRESVRASLSIGPPTSPWTLPIRSPFLLASGFLVRCGECWHSKTCFLTQKHAFWHSKTCFLAVFGFRDGARRGAFGDL